jgi:hypothetical protein
LQEHLLIARLRAGGTICLRPHQAAITAQKVQQLAEIDGDAQRARRVEQVEGIVGMETVMLVGVWLARRSSAIMRSVCVWNACVMAPVKFEIVMCDPSTERPAGLERSMRGERVDDDSVLPRAGEGSGGIKGPTPSP